MYSNTAIVLQVMKIVYFQYRTIVLLSGLIPVGQLVMAGQSLWYTHLCKDHIGKYGETKVRAELLSNDLCSLLTSLQSFQSACTVCC